MTEINLKGDGWESSIKLDPEKVTPEVKKILYEIAEQLLAIPDTPKTINTIDNEYRPKN